MTIKYNIDIISPQVEITFLTDSNQAHRFLLKSQSFVRVVSVCGNYLFFALQCAWRKEDNFIKPDKSTQINEQIRDPEIRVIGSNGEMLGIMSSRSALELAADQGLDLVKISPTAVPPVCKIIDYGKYLFDQKKREKEDSKKQSVVELKEIQLSATIDVGDMKTKANQTAKFLSKGNKIKIALRLKGRQMQHSDLAFEVVSEFLQMLEEGSYKVDKPAKLEGRIISTTISPVNNKK